jgi:nicotinamidase-related amidase
MSAGRLLARSPRADGTVFLLCDIQERFRPLIHRFPTVIQTAKTLTQVARILDIPVVATEQYPKALKHTVEELQPFLASEGNKAGFVTTFPKMKFSMLEQPVMYHIESLRPNFSSAVLYGIETHVCVQQTAMELLDEGVQVRAGGGGRRLRSTNGWSSTDALQELS